MFMQAYYNDTKVSVPSRILMIASAYETLFDLPESGQRQALRAEFERLFDIQGDPRRTFITHRDRRGRDHWVNKSIKIYWANEFYKLRNAIIHGSPIRDSAYIFKGLQPHFDIASLFFVLGVKKYIEAAGCMPPSLDQILWGTNSHPEFDGEGEEEVRQEYQGFLYDRGDLRKAIRRSLRAHPLRRA